MKKSFLLYLLMVAVSGLCLWFIIRQGDGLKVQNPNASTQTVLKEENVTVVAVPLSGISDAFEQFKKNIRHPLSLLFLQISTIFLVSRIFGMLLSLVGQPSVVGEIIAGIALGPSLMGFLFPGFYQFIFPMDSLGNLHLFSQIGLAFFMFIVGMELDLKALGTKAGSALIVSHSSIVVPFLMGAGLSYFLFETYAPAGTSFVAFSLFMGIAMSITAFPVLARIVRERGLSKTPLGNLVITCAAADDITAWCVLAVVIAIAKAGGLTTALFTIILTILFLMIMVLVMRPLIARLASTRMKMEIPGKTVVALSFFVLLSSAFTAEIIGIHALFGSFIAGVIIPEISSFKNRIREKIEDVSVMILLPIFFAFTGLRTQISLLNEGGLWAVCGIIIAVAVAGKFGGSMLAAKITGQNWGDSLRIGALMNTRGLMELIVLNIGYDLGILSPQIFAMMVLMALATTLMTSPTLDLIDWATKKRILAARKSRDNPRVS